MRPIPAAGMILCLLLPGPLSAQRLRLPEGASTRWLVEEPTEIVGWRAFDPAEVSRLLPADLEFTTVGELAERGVLWALEYRKAHPEQATWGVSFLEILVAETFTIDGGSPDWRQDGAVGMWFARVGPSAVLDLGHGVPFLALEFWVPDRDFATYMQDQGHYATYGQVRLVRSASGAWQGSIEVPGLSAAVTCTPDEPVTGGATSRGSQVLVPPALSGVDQIVRITFEGHREQVCSGPDPWSLDGTHPLTRTAPLSPSSLQFGYRLLGGAYVR